MIKQELFDQLLSDVFETQRDYFNYIANLRILANTLKEHREPYDELSLKSYKMLLELFVLTNKKAVKKVLERIGE